MKSIKIWVGPKIGPFCTCSFNVYKKNNKAFGEDLILIEYIKNTEFYYLDIYEILFNVVCNSGIIPESWLIGNIKHI